MAAGTPATTMRHLETACGDLVSGVDVLRMFDGENASEWLHGRASVDGAGSDA